MLLCCICFLSIRNEYSWSLLGWCWVMLLLLKLKQKFYPCPFFCDHLPWELPQNCFCFFLSTVILKFVKMNFHCNVLYSIKFLLDQGIKYQSVWCVPDHNQGQVLDHIGLYLSVLVFNYFLFWYRLIYLYYTDLSSYWNQYQI